MYTKKKFRCIALLDNGIFNGENIKKSSSIKSNLSEVTSKNLINFYAVPLIVM